MSTQSRGPQRSGSAAPPHPRVPARGLDLADADFVRLSRLVQSVAGIRLEPGKAELARSRLLPRLGPLGFTSFRQYIDHVERDGSRQELAAMIDTLTTNKTSFFREPRHFNYLRRRVFPDLRARSRRVRIWSAGCSSGEEAFSLAILLREEFPEDDSVDVRVLATDISARMLAKAHAAVYDEAALRDVPALWRARYFRLVADAEPRLYQVKPELADLVRFALLNLVGEWPMQGPFDVIFCRNVMIYFDTATQQDLVERLWRLLQPGGYLFVGHTESLSALSHPFQYVCPAVYMK